MAVGLGNDFWNNSLYIQFNHNYMVEAEFLPFMIKIFPVILSLIGFSLALIIYTYFTKYLSHLLANNFFRALYMFLNKKWYFDKLYSEVVYQKVLFLSYNPLYAIFDKGIFNILGPRLLTNTLENLSTATAETQTGFFYHYALIFLISVTILILLSHVSIFITFIILSILYFFI